MKFTNIASIATLAATGVVVASAAFAQSRDTIQIAGSSTVLPFASVVAEQFGNTYPEFKTPVVGSGGTGGGLKQFCQGVGDNTIDIADASRPISASEIEACGKAGVKNIIEVKIGYDGIVFASDRSQPAFEDLTPQEVFTAMAAEIPQGGKMVKNPFTNWSQINKDLPKQDITLVIPGTNHGTREVFETNVVNAGCKTYPEIKALDADAQKKACLSFRQDGRVIEVSGDYTETLGRIDAQKNAVGVFGLSFYDQNKDRLQVAKVNGIEPTLDSVATGKYPVSRPLFFYIKGEHMDAIPGIKDYADFFLSDQMTGGEGQLVDIGLIPMSDEERQAQLDKVENKTTLKPATN